MSLRAKPKIVIIGGGFAGLESAFYLRQRLQEQADISLISNRDSFLYKPDMVYVPFGLDPQTLYTPLAKPTKQKNIRFVLAHVQEIDPFRQVVQLTNTEVPYDYLIVATGAKMSRREIPGLATYAQTIWTPTEMISLKAKLAHLVEQASSNHPQKVLFLVPPNNGWAGPLYELALMLDTWLVDKGARANIALTWSTYEDWFLQAYGPRAHQRLLFEFELRGIYNHLCYQVTQIKADHVSYQNGKQLPYDLLITFPPHLASTPFDGLPTDATDKRGYLKTDFETRQVIDHPNIYAVGDASDFPIKQGYLACLQADAAAEHIAAQILGHPPTAFFKPTGFYVMEELNTATFVQAPFRQTDEETQAVEIDPEAIGDYQVETAPFWRLGKKGLGLYLPWRIRRGQPMYNGLAWQGIEMGVQAATQILNQTNTRTEYRREKG